MKKSAGKSIAKIISKILITTTLTTLVSTLTVNTAWAAFSDLSPTHKNYEAIIYLQENNIISGYPDGTFKPDNNVNRAEFLKIIINGSAIDLNIETNTPFPDVDHRAWYGPYLKKAYAQGWINGYPDGTFKPEQTINKAEALKILAKVQNWQTDQYFFTEPFNDTPSEEWYTPYIAYAKDHQFLEERGFLFFPAMLMTRAKISEIIYRSLTVEQPDDSTDDDRTNDQPDDSADTTDNDTDTDDQPTDVTTADDTDDEDATNFTPVTFDTIATNFYDDITLDETLSNTFYKDEVYTISGIITSGTFDSATIILDATTHSYYKTFSAEVTNNRFSVPIHFSGTGNYNLGLLPGDSGSSSAVSISVLTNLPTSSNTNASPVAATNVSAHYADDRSYIDFSTPSSYLKKITLSQNNKTVNYYSRQNITSVPVTYSDFENFSAGTVTYTVEAASLSSQKPLQISSSFISSSSKTLQATQHTFSDINRDKITATPPDTLTSASNFSFSGTAKTDIEKTAYVIKPDGFVETFDLTTTSATGTYLSKSIINNGGNFTFTYTPQTTGRYILEINDKNGEPILNHPVYVGSEIALIPDFFDLNEREFFSGTFNLTTFRQELLDKINADRVKHGLNTITIADDINVIAQSHSEDMKANNFFGHVNPAGETPNDRRLAAGITTAVSENIAKDVAIDFGHEGLMRSASHRENILTADWTRVGLGIAQTTDGYLIITEEFSTNVITDSDLVNYKQELESEINNLRSQNSLSSLVVNTALEATSSYLNTKVINEGQTLTNSLFTEALDANNVSGSSEAIGRTYSLWTDILSSILTEEPGLIESQWQLMGADLKLDSSGSIHTIVTINQP